MRIRALPAVLFWALLLAPALCRAEIPMESLQRVADIRVEIARLRHMEDMKQITYDEMRRRTKLLDAQERAVAASFRNESPENFKIASATIQGLFNAKMTVLRAEWDKEKRDARTTAESISRQTERDLEADAGRAAKIQKDRTELQRQLNAGSLNAETFRQKDEDALRAIAALRKKYEEADRPGTPTLDRRGRIWAGTFDKRVDELTRKAVAAAAKPPAPAPRVAVAQAPPPPPPLPEWVKRLPSAEKVMADYGGEGEDTALRQLGALVVLREALVYWGAFEFGPQNLRQELRDKIAEYQKAEDALRAAHKWSSEDADRYVNSFLFARAVAKRYLDWNIEQSYVRRLVMESSKLQTVSDWIVSYSLKSGYIVSELFTILTQFILKYIWWGLGGLGLVGLFYWLATRKPEEEESIRPPVTTNHGSAVWAERELKPSSSTHVGHGVIFGKSSAPHLPPDAKGAPITSTPETHTLIVAKTRAGKGTTVLIPTLLRYLDSMIVIDPKGENAAITALARQRLGQKVHIVNPWGELEDDFKALGLSAGSYNPLDALHRDDPNVGTIAESLATIIIPPGVGKEAFWQGSAMLILKVVFQWLAYQPGETKTLARAREIVTMMKSEFRKILQDIAASGAYGGALKEDIGQILELPPELYGSVMFNLNVNTRFISDARVKAATSSSSFSMDRLRSEATTVYIVVPFDIIRNNSTLLRLIIASAMHGIKRKSAKQRIKHRCMFMMDEFGIMGRIEELPTNMSAMTGYGVDFVLAAQTLSQLEGAYGKEDFATIMGACTYKWFSAVADDEAAKRVSEQLGQATIQTMTKSVSNSTSSGTGSNPGSSSSSTSYNFGEMGKPLLRPDELQKLGNTASILQKTGDPPRFLRPVSYRRLKEEYEHLRDEYPELFWHPEVTFEPNPIHEREEAARRYAAEQRRLAAEERKAEAERLRKEEEARKAAKRGFAGVAGMEKLKDILRRDVIAPLREPEKYAKFRVTIPNGILLFGPPGCGKTFIVRKLAEEIGYNFVECSGSAFASTYIHGSVQKIKEVFTEALNKAPTLLFIDEIDSLVPRRDDLSQHQEHKKEEVNEFLTNLDNAGKRNILVVGATNFPEKIDKGILRAGRMDKRIFVPPPDLEARQDLFRLELSDRPHSAKINVAKLAGLTENYTSADIAMILDDAARDSATSGKPEIDLDAITSALARGKPSISTADIERYSQFVDMERA